MKKSDLDLKSSASSAQDLEGTWGESWKFSDEIPVLSWKSLLLTVPSSVAKGEGSSYPVLCLGEALLVAIGSIWFQDPFFALDKSNCSLW